MEPTDKTNKLTKIVIGMLSVGAIIVVGIVAVFIYSLLATDANFRADRAEAKKNAEAMVEFSGGDLPEGVGLFRGRESAGARSFTASLEGTGTWVTISSVPGSPASTTKDLVLEQMKAHKWKASDTAKFEEKIVGGEQMYYALKKETEPPPDNQPESANIAAKNKVANKGDSTETATEGSGSSSHDTVSVVYAAKNIESGEIIAQDKLQERRVEASKVPVDAYSSVDSIVGLQAVYDIPAGKMIIAPAVKPIPVITGERPEPLIGAVITKDGHKYLIEGSSPEYEPFNSERAFGFLAYIKRWK